MTSTDIIPPWYKQFWPWFLLAIPGITIVSGIAMLLIASHNPDGLVVDDYYKTGLAINRTLARDDQARQLGLSATGKIDKTSQSIQVLLQGQDRPFRLKLTLTHPTTSQQDIVIALQRQNNRGEYTGLLAQHPTGKRYLLLEPLNQSWRLIGSVHFDKVKSWQLEPVK